jgi:hypothetical protein
MTQLVKLKSAVSLHDVAHLLGFQPKALAYILYKKAPELKYKQFQIPKRTGGLRTINAPSHELMTLQGRLSILLQNCIDEINVARNVRRSLSHGFRRKCSIMTNADVHRNRRYVLNLDLENFFGTINFGRVRGFFITNRNFELNKKVATILAQIACHENELPQGSPCSPVISNLIGHLLDIPLAAIATKYKCSYSRYADDLTFSTNRRDFPKELAFPVIDGEHQWTVGNELAQVIKRAGFTINVSKTRMQYRDSRQDVTGLIVNSKVNTRSEYKRGARAMSHRLLKTGKYQIKQTILGEDGKVVTKEIDGSLNQLQGVFSFIDSVNLFNKRKAVKVTDKAKVVKLGDRPSSMESLYRSFLIYRNFYAAPKPVILCEGKTDNVYIRAAIRRLSSSHPQLANKDKSGKIQIDVRLFRYSKTTERMLGLGGGSGELKNLINLVKNEFKKISAPGKSAPVILLIDNDDGSKEIFSTVNTLAKKAIADRKSTFIHVMDNIYVVPTPLKSDGSDSMIEDFFEKSVRDTKLGGKVFNPSNKGLNHKTEYGKHYFAEHVVKKNESKINFAGFNDVLDRIDQVIIEHGKKMSK